MLAVRSVSMSMQKRKFELRVENRSVSLERSIELLRLSKKWTKMPAAIKYESVASVASVETIQFSPLNHVQWDKFRLIFRSFLPIPLRIPHWIGHHFLRLGQKKQIRKNHFFMCRAVKIPCDTLPLAVRWWEQSHNEMWPMCSQLTSMYLLHLRQGKGTRRLCCLSSHDTTTAKECVCVCALCCVLTVLTHHRRRSALCAIV